MTDYMEYIKVAEVLISPSLDYKDQYILKCTECEECFSDMESLLLHCVNHYQYDDAELEEKSVSGLIDDMFDGDENEMDVQENVTVKYEYLSEGEGEGDELDHLSLIGIEEEEYLIERDDTCKSSTDGNDNEDKEEECILGYPDSDEEGIDSEDSKTSLFVRKFLHSKLNVSAMISAYKKQPFLWNTNNPSQLRAKERPKCLNKIAEEIKEKVNVIISSKEVAAIITRFRHMYREKMKRIAECGESAKSKNSRMWYFEQLNFLQPYMENNSIYTLDPHQPQLEQDQVMQILDIYKSLPVLWNTDLIENVCSNKRLEAIGQMQSLLETEMGLKANVNTLKKYIHCINMFFSREKRGRISNVHSTRDRIALYKHMIFLFDHVGPFKCSQCQRAFLTPLNLKVHMAEHDGSIPLKCSLCNKEYKTTDAYMAHARRHMNDLKNECKECGKKFSRPVDLEIHQRCHTGSKPYCCEICGASYRHSQAFTTHKRRHLKQYLHHCPVCSKGFYKKDQMNNHLRTHGDERDFKCKLCGKSFKTKKTMQQHMFTHEEGRNHVCPICDKTFKNKIGLGQHMKIHRKIEFVESDAN